MNKYIVDRFREGRLMAECGKVSAIDEKDALEKVQRMFSDCPGDTFKIRYKVGGEIADE